MPRINTTLGKGYVGIGDMVSLAWIAEGTRGSPDPITFYARGANRTVLQLLGQEVTDQPEGDGSGIELSPAYTTELAEGGARLRLDYIRDLLGIDAPPKRPPVRIPPDALEWARQNKQGLGDNDLVLLFPQTAWKTRAWPAAYWVELAWWLNARNVAVVIMMADEDKQFTNTPRFMWGFDFFHVAAMMSVAKMVVGSDSGPVHLAGTIGVSTMALCGPTRADCVFGHVPEVIGVTCDETPFCAGCHFQPPFRAACDQGCQALFALKPHRVLGRIFSELALINLRPPTMPAGLATAQPTTH